MYHAQISNICLLDICGTIPQKNNVDHGAENKEKEKNILKNVHGNFKNKTSSQRRI